MKKKIRSTTKKRWSHTHKKNHKMRGGALYTKGLRNTVRTPPAELTLFYANGIRIGDRFKFYTRILKSGVTEYYFKVSRMEVVDRRIHRIHFVYTDETGSIEDENGDYDLEFPQFEKYIKRSLLVPPSRNYPQIQLLDRSPPRTPLFNTSGFIDVWDALDSRYNQDIYV